MGSTIQSVSSKLRGCGLEGTVRRGRRLRPPTSIRAEQPWRLGAGDTRLFTRQLDPAKSDADEQIKELGGASSLPHQATQVPVSLTSLCTALSTPADAQQGSLAAAQPATCDPGVGPRLRLIGTAQDGEMLAAALAFLASGTDRWGCLLDSTAAAGNTAAPALDASDAFPWRGQPELTAAARADCDHLCNNSGSGRPAAADAVDEAIRMGVAIQSVDLSVETDRVCNAQHSSSSSKNYNNTLAMQAGAVFGATRRGLYDGTVRGGGPRNAWRHCWELPAASKPVAAPVC